MAYRPCNGEITVKNDPETVKATAAATRTFRCPRSDKCRRIQGNAVFADGMQGSMQPVSPALRDPADESSCRDYWPPPWFGEGPMR